MSFTVVLLWSLVVIAVLAVLYLLMITPHIGSKTEMEPFFNKLYAHRGLYDNETDAPENSMKAFEKAVEAGFGMEMDVQLSKDGVPVVFHDYTLERMCHVPGKVCDYTYEELQQFPLGKSTETIPKFEDVLNMVDGREPLIVEIKVEKFDLSVCKKADDLLQKYKGMYCVESFHPFAVRWFRRKHKDIMRGQLSNGFIKECDESKIVCFLLQNLMLNFLGRPDFIAYNHKYDRIFSRRICRKMFKNTAAAWTIQSEEELKKARKGFDMFIFDSFVPDPEQKKVS